MLEVACLDFFFFRKFQVGSSDSPSFSLNKLWQIIVLCWYIQISYFFKTRMCSKNSILSMHFLCYFQLVNHFSENGTMKKPY